MSKASAFTVQKFHYYSTVFPEYLMFQWIQQIGWLLIPSAIDKKNIVLLILIFIVLEACSLIFNSFALKIYIH